ncbi:sugar porter family MFS transporter [Kineococcus arenarius]|uniref:sugar porter family MFS transporter n=1 Tax=Kineococcus sp. SYSU DK007 TaxID=3383128 RepID=UPI003D7E7722
MHARPSTTRARPPHRPSPDRRLALVAATATLGGFLFGYDTGVISGALLFLGDDLGLSPAGEGLVTSSLLVGAAAGGVAGGRLADAHGRRRALLVLAVVFLAGALGSALAPGAGVLVAARVVLGLAVGGASAVVPVYIAELAPARRRGGFVAAYDLSIVSGQLAAYTANALIASVGGEHEWRWMLALASLPAVALFLGVLALPDSPRWFVEHGRAAEALAVLRQVRRGAEAEAELAGIQAAARAGAGAGRSGWRDLRTPWVRRLVLVGVLLSVVQQVTGVNTIMYYAPTVLVTTGLGDGSALAATIANGVVSVVAAATAVAVINRFGRRRMLLTGQVGITASLLALAACFALAFTAAGAPGADPGTLTPRFPQASWLVLLAMLTFLFFQQCCVSPVTWALLSEIFPTRLRGLGVGVSVFAQWVVNFAVVLAFPVLLDRLGGGATFLLFAAVNTVAVVLVLRHVPETRGRSLEELESRFRTAGGAGGPRR